MSAEIQCDRRRLLGTAALLFAAGPLGMLGAAHAQSGTTPPAPQPASEGHLENSERLMSVIPE